MSDIEQKALALLNESGWKGAYLKRAWNCRYEALCRAIEQHEAFRREVSDAVEDLLDEWCKQMDIPHSEHPVTRFIIPKPVDPLVEALGELADRDMQAEQAAETLREALAKRGGRIVFGEAGE